MIKLAKELIIKILSANETTEALQQIFQIQSGNKELLYKHILALSNIFNKAKEEYERNNKRND